MFEYTLTLVEQELCEQAAADRHARSVDLRLPNKIESLGRSLEHERQSIAAEIAAARAFGLPWTEKQTVQDDRLGDIVPGLQVRHTAHKRGSLILRAQDNLDHDFVLVIGTYPEFVVKGWINGHDGLKLSREGKQQHIGPSFRTVAQQHLRPVSEHELCQPVLKRRPAAAVSLFAPAPLLIRRLAAA